MDDSTYIVARTIVALSLTYCIHSTILICAVWLVHRVFSLRITSHALSERMWKMAAVLGLVTAPLQLSLSWHGPHITLPIRLDVRNLDESVELVAVQTSGASWDARSDRQARSEGTGMVGHVLPTTPADFGSGRGGMRPSPPPDTDRQAHRHRSVVRQPESFSMQGGLSGLLPAARTESDPVSERAPPDPPDADTPRLGALIPLSGVQHAETRTTTGTESAHGASWAPIVVNTLAALVLVAMAFGGVCLVVQSVLLYSRFSDAGRSTEGCARRTLAGLQRRHQLPRHVRLITSNRCTEPLSYGLFRWTIVMPAGLAEQLTRRELRALLAHELAHLTRGDVRWLWIGRILCSCLAFQPLNRLARRRWQHAVEFCCDDWAVERGQTQMDLARCLTRVSQWRIDGPDRSIALAATGNRTSVLQRVERLVHPPLMPDRWTTPWRQRLLVVTSLAIAAGIFLGAPCISFAVTNAEDPTTANVTVSKADDINTAAELPPARVPRWESLDEPLARLERDIERATQLLSELPEDHDLQTAVSALRERKDELHRRRANLNRLMADHFSSKAELPRF